MTRRQIDLGKVREDIPELCQHRAVRYRQAGEMSELARDHEYRDAEQISAQNRPGQQGGQVSGS